MVLLFWIILIITIGMIGGIIYITYQSRNNEDKIDASLLYNVIKIVFGVFLLVYIMSLGISLWGINMSEAMLILFTKMFIYIVFFLFIFLNTKDLLTNLKNDDIFIDENYILTKKIGELFLYLALTETLTGFLLDLIDVFGRNGFTFNVTTNFSIFIFVIIGLVLILVSKILQKAIAIYKENQLTI